MATDCLNKAVAALVLTATLAACSAGPDIYYDRRDAIHLSAGDANASNIASQTIDPWPRHAAYRDIQTNGEKIQPAIQRYKEGKVTPPRGLGTSSIEISPSAASPNDQK
ncbi:MAG: hypothetical protein KF807_00815 [Xanthobacteraceae bacterium]|nr:hypothetical protein [Xanthobacteraceae bacterium]